MDFNVWKCFRICGKHWIAFYLIMCVIFSACVDGQGTFQTMGPRLFSAAFRAQSQPSFRLHVTCHISRLATWHDSEKRAVSSAGHTVRPQATREESEQRMREPQTDNSGNPWENRPTNTFANRQHSNERWHEHIVRGNINSAHTVQNNAQNSAHTVQNNAQNSAPINVPGNQRNSIVTNIHPQDFRSNRTPQDNVLHRSQSVQTSNVGVNRGFSNDNARFNVNNRDSPNLSDIHVQRPLIIRRTQTSGPDLTNSSTENTRNFIVIRNHDATMNAQTAQVPSVSHNFRPIPMVPSTQTNPNDIQSNSLQRPFLPFSPSVLQQRASSTRVNTVLQPDTIHVVPQHRGHQSDAASNAQQAVPLTTHRESVARSQQISAFPAGIHRPDAVAAQPLSPTQASGILMAATNDASGQRVNSTEVSNASPMNSGSIRLVNVSGNRSIIVRHNQASLQPVQSPNTAHSAIGNQAISATGLHHNPVDSVHNAILMPSPTQSTIQRILVPMGKIVQSNWNVQHAAPGPSPTPMEPLTRVIFQALGLPTDTVSLGGQSGLSIAQAQALQRHIQPIQTIQASGISNFPHVQQPDNFGHVGLSGGMLYNNHMSSFNQFGNPFLSGMYLGGESPDSPDIPDPIPTPVPPTTPGPATIANAIMTEVIKPVDPATSANKVAIKNKNANAGGGQVEEEEEFEDLPPTTTEAPTTTTTTTVAPTTSTTTPEPSPTTTNTTFPTTTTLVPTLHIINSQVVESLAERILALLNPKTEVAIAAPAAKTDIAPVVAPIASQSLISDGGRAVTSVGDTIGTSVNVAPEPVGTFANTVVSPVDTLVKTVVNPVISSINNDANIIDFPVNSATESVGVSVHSASNSIQIPVNAASFPASLQAKPAVYSVPPPSAADSTMRTLYPPQSNVADAISKPAASGPVLPIPYLPPADQPKQDFLAPSAPQPARRTFIVVRRNPDGSTSGVQRIIVKGDSPIPPNHVAARTHITRASPESALQNTNVNVEVKKAADRLPPFERLGISHVSDTVHLTKDGHMDNLLGNIHVNAMAQINPTNNHVPMGILNANLIAQVKPTRDANTPSKLNDFGKHGSVSNHQLSPDSLKPLLNTVIFPASQDIAHAQHFTSYIPDVADGNVEVLRSQGVKRTPILQTAPLGGSSTTLKIQANKVIESLPSTVTDKDTSNTVLPQSMPKPNAHIYQSNKASPVMVDKSVQVSAIPDQSFERAAGLNQSTDNTLSRISPEMLIKELQLGATGVAGSANVNDQQFKLRQMLVNFLKQSEISLNEQPPPILSNEAGAVSAAADFNQNVIPNISPLSLNVNSSPNMAPPSLVDSMPVMVDSPPQTVNGHARISLVPAALAPEVQNPALPEAPLDFAPFMSSNDFGGLTMQRHQTTNTSGTPKQQFNSMDATQVLSALQADQNTNLQQASIEYVLSSLQTFLSSNRNAQNTSFTSLTPTTTTTTITTTPKPTTTSTTTTVPPSPSNNAMDLLASLSQLQVSPNSPADAVSFLENLKKLLMDAGISLTTTATPTSSSTTATIPPTTTTTAPSSTTTQQPTTTTTPTTAAPCTPLSANFRCVGKEMFAAMESMGAWCIGMCVKDACVHTVCECGCNVTQTAPPKVTTTQKTPTTTTDEPPEEEEENEVEDVMTTTERPSTTTTVNPVPPELRNLLPTSPSPSEDFTLNPLDKHSSHARQLNKHVDTLKNTSIAWGSQSKKDVKKEITTLAEGNVFTPKVGESAIEATTRAAPAPDWSGTLWGLPPQPIPTVPEPTPVERNWQRRPLREKWSRSERFSSLINQNAMVQPQLQVPPNMLAMPQLQMPQNMPAMPQLQMPQNMHAMMWLPVPSMANGNPFGQRMGGMRFTWGNQASGGKGGEGASGGQGNEADDKK